MITKELLFFIKQSKAAGKTNEQIKSALMQNGGWAPSDIEEGFRQASLGDNPSNVPPPAPASPVSNVVGVTPPVQAKPTPLINFPPSIQGQMINPINQRPVSVARPQPAPSQMAMQQPVTKKKGGSGGLIFFIFFLLALGATGYYFKDAIIQKFFPVPTETVAELPVVHSTLPSANSGPIAPGSLDQGTATSDTQTNPSAAPNSTTNNTATLTTPPVTTMAPAPAPTLMTSGTKVNCDNSIQCLIFAATTCQEVPGIVTYTNTPNPLLAGFVQSGQTKYEIKKAPVTKPANNNCILTSSVLSSTISITDEAHKTALAQGTTESQLNTTLKTMNDSLKGVVGMTTTCISTGGDIASYFTDVRDMGGAKSTETKIVGTTSTTTYTTSTGKKLTCTTGSTSSTAPLSKTTTSTSTTTATPKQTTQNTITTQ